MESKMTVEATYQYDQDPRYGNIYVDMDEGDSPTFVIHKEGQCYGFELRDGKMHPVCLCSARYAGECFCETGNWD